MSHYDLSPEKVRLVADAGDPTTEVFVINGRFDRVVKGLGHVDAQLPPGLYKVKFAAGSFTREVHVTLEPGGSPTIVRPQGDLLFSTSAPIEKTGTTHEYHEYSANLLSTRLHHVVGTGSQLFVFVRDFKKQEGGDPAMGLTLYDDDPATDLTLHDLAGNLLVDFKLVGEREIHDPVKDPWAGCNILLDPGSYRLRVRTNTAGSLEQIVVTSPGWQTQVFLLRRRYGDEYGERRADLGNASILMAPEGFGFNPFDLDLRRVELARQGLAIGRVVVDASVLRGMFASKFVYPMLGIYGAHLLLLSQEPDHELLREVVHNLYTLLGPHPDVISLDIWLGPPNGVPVYQSPPMLRSSWRIIVNASIAHPEIIPTGSFAVQIADRIWGDSAWLVWQEPSEPVEPFVPVDATRLQGILPQIADILSETPSSEPAAEIAQAKKLNNLEHNLLEYIARTAPLKEREAPDVQLQRERERDEQAIQDLEQMFPPLPLIGELAPGLPLGPSESSDMLRRFSTERESTAQLQAWSADHLNDAALAQALGVPTAAIREAAAGLIEKLTFPGTNIPSS